MKFSSKAAVFGAAVLALTALTLSSCATVYPLNARYAADDIGTTFTFLGYGTGGKSLTTAVKNETNAFGGTLTTDYELVPHKGNVFLALEVVLEHTGATPSRIPLKQIQIVGADGTAYVPVALVDSLSTSGNMITVAKTEKQLPDLDYTLAVPKQSLYLYFDVPEKLVPTTLEYFGQTTAFPPQH